MAKQKELNQLKKGTASFTLVGKAKVSDYTFTLDAESKREDSDWVYSRLNLGVDCGNKCGTIYSELQGGYGTDRENKVYVHGKKKDEKSDKYLDDFKNFFTVAWEDRDDEDILETVGEMCFITVGIEKDSKDKIVYKKFIAPYDAVAYAQEIIEDGMVVKVNGNIKWKEYNGKTQMTKEITHILLSNAKEEDFVATFEQTILTDKDSIGKLDKDSMSIPITGYVLAHVIEFKGQKISKNVDGKVKKGTTLPLVKEFEMGVSPENKEQIVKVLKLFKAKPKKVTQITVEGFFSRGDVDTTTVQEVDIPDDIKELIEMGLIKKEDVLDKVAFANGTNNNKPEKMVIKSPKIKAKKDDGISIDRIADIYDEDDIDVNLILEQFDTVMEDTEEEVNIDNALDAALESEDDEEEDWLSDL